MDSLDHSKKSFSLEGTVEKFEHKNAWLVLADGQRLSWPINNLPNDAEVGSPVRLLLSTAESQAAESEIIAKAILNQIKSIQSLLLG